MLNSNFIFHRLRMYCNLFLVEISLSFHAVLYVSKATRKYCASTDTYTCVHVYHMCGFQLQYLLITHWLLLCLNLKIKSKISNQAKDIHRYCILGVTLIVLLLRPQLLIIWAIGDVIFALSAASTRFHC